MRNLFFLIFTLFSLFSSSVQAGLTELCDSVCRIQNQNEENADKYCYGTGFAYKEDKSQYYILSVGHYVLEDENKIKKPVNFKFTSVTLFHNGLSWKIPGHTIFHVYNEHTFYDVSVVTVDKSVMKGKYEGFKLVKFGLNYKPKPNTIIWSYGCPNGDWPTGLKGRLLGTEDGFLKFSPPIICGRSGSPVLDHYGNNVIGMGVMCDGITSLAIPIDSIQAILATRGLEQ